MAGSWVNFWKGEKNGFFKIMEMSTGVFAKRFVREMQIHKNTSILDFGCGPGFLIDELILHSDKISGADVNEYFIDICKQKYPLGKFLNLSGDVNKLEFEMKSMFDNQQFDYIVLLSVIQYFDGLEQLKHSLQILKSYLGENGSVVIADVITRHTSTLKDFLSISKQALLTNNTTNLIKFIFYLIWSTPIFASKKVNHQTYTIQEIGEIASGLGLKFITIDNFTLHPTRSNLLLNLM